LRGNALLGALSRQARENVAAAQRRCLRQQRLEIGEGVAALTDGRALHRESCNLQLGLNERVQSVLFSQGEIEIRPKAAVS
jgi:hypothetical protein